MANGVEISKSDVVKALSKSMLQHHILKISPIISIIIEFRKKNLHKERKKKKKSIKYMRTRIGHVA